MRCFSVFYLGFNVEGGRQKRLRDVFEFCGQQIWEGTQSGESMLSEIDLLVFRSVLPWKSKAVPLPFKRHSRQGRIDELEGSIVSQCIHFSFSELDAGKRKLK